MRRRVTLCIAVLLMAAIAAAYTRSIAQGGPATSTRAWSAPQTVDPFREVWSYDTGG